MRKILILLLVLVALGVGYKSAEALTMNTEAKLTVGFTNLSLGTFYEWDSQDLLIGGTMAIVSWKFISADAGLLTNVQDNVIPIGSLTVDIKKLSNLIGLNYELLDPFKIGIWYGFEMQENRTQINHYGLYATIDFNLSK